MLAPHQQQQQNSTSGRIQQYFAQPVVVGGGNGNGNGGHTTTTTTSCSDDTQSVLDYGGLSNGVSENNCFLNAVIQILYNADFFRRSLRNLAALELGQFPNNFNVHWRHRCSSSSSSKQLRSSSSNSKGNSCIFCELVKLFDSLRVAQQSHRRFHDPNTLRLALQGSVVSNINGHSTFRLNQMNDSVECFEQILKTLHGYTSSTATEDRTAPHSSDCNSETCVCHRQFSLTIAEQKSCSCGLANSEVQIATDLVERVYVVPLLRAATRNSQTPCGPTSPAVPSFSDLLRIAQCSVDPPLVCQGPRCGRLVYKTRRLLCKPDAVAISLTFPTACPDDLTLKQVIDLIEPTIEPARVYSSVSSHSAFPELFQLSGIICYHGQHYLAICYHSTRKVWNVISDSVVKLIGSSWADVRAYLRRAPCIPCLLLYTNTQAVPLPRSLNGSAVPAANQPEPIYFDRQAVQEMLAKSLKFSNVGHQQQPSVSIPHGPLTQLGYNSGRRPCSSDTTESSGYGSKSSSTASSTSQDSGASSSCSPSPPSKSSNENSNNQANLSRSHYNYQHNSNSLDKLTSLLPPPQLILPPNDGKGAVAARFQQADLLCQRLLAQLGAKQYAESLVACQQAANVLRSALVTNTGNGVTIENITSPHVISAKRRIDWLAHYERAIMRKLGNSTTQTVPHASSFVSPTAPLSTFLTVPKQQAESNDKDASSSKRTTLRQLKKTGPTQTSPLRGSLPDIHQSCEVSKEAEDVPDRLSYTGSRNSLGWDETATLPRKLRPSPSSSNVPLTQNEHLQLASTIASTTTTPPTSSIPFSTVKPRFVAVRGPGVRVSLTPSMPPPEKPISTEPVAQQQEMLIRPTPAPPSVSGDSQCSAGSSGHGSAASSVTMQTPSWNCYNVRKSALRSSRTSSSSLTSSSTKSVKFNDQVAVITEDLGPQDPIVDDSPVTVSMAVEIEESSQVSNYSVYVQRLVEHTRKVVYPTTKEQSEQFYCRRAVSNTSLRTVAKLNDRSSSPPPPLVTAMANLDVNNEAVSGSTDSSDNTSLDEDSASDTIAQTDGGHCCALCSKALQAESDQQYCHRCSAYLSRFSTTTSSKEASVDDPSSGITYTAVANGAIF